MASATEAIQEFLETHPGAEAQQLDIAIVFASSMLRELRENVSEWQQIADALDDERRSRPTPTAN